MSERKRLADRRHCELVDFESMGLRFTAGIGRYPDGRIAELFLDNHKAGSAIGALVRDAAVILSFALQHGADPEANPARTLPRFRRPRLRAARRNSRSRP
jgi:hypothetical protein